MFVCPGLAAAAAALSLAAAVASVWPGLGCPAWPAASLGVLALALPRPRAPVLSRALTTIVASLALTLGLGQIVVLWAIAFTLPRVL